MTTQNQEAIFELLEAQVTLLEGKSLAEQSIVKTDAGLALISDALATLQGPPPSPTITIVPPTGTPGTRITVHGFNFSPPAARVFVLVERQHMFSPTIRDDGEFHGEFTLPSFLPGEVMVNVVLESAPDVIIASVPFTVTAAPPQPPALVVTNLTLSTGRGNLDNAGLTVGRILYTDRPQFTFDAPIPPEVGGGILIRTANDDANNDEANYIKFDVNLPVNVYVLYDKRENPQNLPMWLQDWANTGLNVRTTDTHGRDRYVLKKSFPAGTVTLGGGGMPPNNWVGSNYNVVIKAA